MYTGKKMFSIGEIAHSIGITRKIILNYENKGLVIPDIKNGENGNRYYTVDTFTKIHTIRILQKSGLTLDEIKKYLDGTTELSPLIDRLIKMRDEIDLNIRKLSELADAEPEEIKEIYLDRQTVYRHLMRAENVEAKTEILRNVALEAINLYGADVSKRLYFIEYGLDSPENIFFCASVPEKSEGKNVLKLPPAKAISIFHHGPYEKIGETRDKLVRFAEDNGLNSLGMCRHIYIEGSPQHKDENQFITQVVLLIE